MCDSNEQTDNKVKYQQHEEVDYADPESPTLEIRQFASPTTGSAERLTDVADTDNTADTADTLLPGGAPTPGHIRRCTNNIPTVRSLETRFPDFQ